MSVYACGNNTCSQIVAGGPSILCCPSLIFLTGVSQVEATFSHILWRTESGWKWTGYKQYNDEISIDPEWKVFISENRTVAISSTGSLVVWEDKGWRTLHFQNDYTEATDAAAEVYSGTQNQRYSDNLIGKEEHESCTNSDHKKTEEDCDGLSLVSVEDDSMKGICLASRGKRKMPSKLQDNSIRKKMMQEKLHNASCGMQTLESNKPHIVFCHVAVEDNVLLALGKDGKMYSGSIPISLGLKVTEVAVGKEHSMALTTNGDVLTWGGGMRGQLGNGEICQREKPELVEHLQGITISSVVCGGWHSVALSSSGDVYVWGWNESGQLGFPSKSQSNHSIFGSFEHKCWCPKNVEKVRKEENSNPLLDRVNQEHTKDVVNVQASPRLLDFWSEHVKVVDVQCGDRHTLFQLDDGSAWSVGMNKYGQLGLGHTDMTEEPTQVFNSGVTRIYAGGWNSIFVTIPC
ncbi:probable E3 ubiquitin-protein ligase HERC3 [Cherax quadricarinatus]